MNIYIWAASSALKSVIKNGRNTECMRAMFNHSHIRHFSSLFVSLRDFQLITQNSSENIASRLSRCIYVNGKHSHISAIFDNAFQSRAGSPDVYMSMDNTYIVNGIYFNEKA